MNINLTKTCYGILKWGDYGNDGYSDIFQSGYNPYNLISKIYENSRNNNFIELTNLSIEGVFYSSVSWGDYNNDGYLDFVYTGATDYYNITKVFKNNGNNTFDPQNDLLIPNIAYGSVEWGDCNNDGFLDILITGWTGTKTRIATIYKNNKGENFTELEEANFIGVSQGHTIWGDYNNDGLSDVLLTGWDSSKKDIRQTR